MEVLGRVTLVTGKEEFLGERTVAAVRDAVRTADAEAEFSETQGSGLTLATLGELAAPSLFSSVRCVVVRQLEDLPDESVDGLLDYAAAPADDVALVLVHSGGAKGSGVLTKLRKLPAVTEAKSAELRPSEFPGFVAGEVEAPRRPDRRRRGRGPGAGGRPGPALPGGGRAPARPTTSRARRSRSPIGEEVLRRPRRDEVLRGRRRGLLRAARSWPSRSCAGRSTAGRRRCWSPRRSPAASAGWPATTAPRRG